MLQPPQLFGNGGELVSTAIQDKQRRAVVDRRATIQIDRSLTAKNNVLAFRAPARLALVA
jgi:hypothetical protein